MSDSVLKAIVEVIAKIAQLNNIHPSQVTKGQFHKNSTISDWTLRKLGGFDQIKKSHFPVSDKEFSMIEEMRAMKNYASKLEKELGKKQVSDEQLLDTIQSAIKNLNFKKASFPKVYPDKKKKSMTLELMLSDIHYGKKTENFNLEVCRTRVRYLTSVFLQEIKDKNKTFSVDRLIVALLGDIIESYTMHNLESAIGCEFGNSQQVQCAIESLFEDVLVPIAATGIKADVVCVTGNHDRSETNRTMNNPGENNLSWIVYQSLKLLCDAKGLNNFTFHIPKDSFTILNVYSNNILYEHGDNVNASSKEAFEKLIQSRSRQSGLVIDMARFGHWHEYACYGRGRIIVNESVCGQDSYAKVKGFDTSAGQTINYYIQAGEKLSCFYRSYPVYLES